MRKAFALLWLALVLLAGGHVIWVAQHGMPLDSDLMALLPREERDPAVQRAKDRMAETLSRRLVVMVGHRDRAIARTQAAALRDALVAEGLAEPRSDIPGPDAIRRLGAAYFPHRAGLLSDDDWRRLKAGDGQGLVNRALAQVYGVAGPVDSKLLAHDPLLLFPAFLSSLPGPANRLAVDEGMLSTVDDGTTWVMAGLVLTGEPYALSLQRRVQAIYDRVIAEAPEGTRWLRLGALFYAQAGADQGMRESTLIGSVSLACTVLLILAAFRSVQPLVLALVAMTAGLAMALSACLALFGSLHVAAQLFGVSLIGVAVDYALHYFGQAFNPEVRPAERLSRVRAGLVLGAATTVIGYATLALSPFPGLRQVAVFSSVGLAGSLATVVLWFPLLDRTPPRVLHPALAAGAARLYQFWDDTRLKVARRWALGLLLVAGLAGMVRIEADDDIRRQQNLSPALAAEQAEIQRLTGFGLTGQFFLVVGASEQQVLEREEALGERLAGLTGWQAAARYVPSAKRQAETAALAERALYVPHLETYRMRVGMERAAAPIPAETPLNLAAIREAGALPFLDALMVDETMHVVTLDRVGDLARVAQTAQDVDGVRFIDPTADLGALLRAYRLRALALLAVSIAAMMPALAWRYGWRGALGVAAPAAAALVLTPPLLALAGIGFSFFSAMALVLVLSIGVDYAVFCAEDHDRDAVTLFSVSLATLTTLLSFGLLAASDLAGVRAFGWVMLVGVALAFLLAPSVSARPRRSSGRSTTPT